jgi:hypothetical protein
MTERGQAIGQAMQAFLNSVRASSWDTKDKQLGYQRAKYRIAVIRGLTYIKNNLNVSL